MISINALNVTFGADVLFDGIGFNLDDGEKVGLAGKNGAGKSTLLKIICGQMVPTSGSVDKPRDVRCGYLPQIMSHNKGRTVMEEVMTAFQERFDLEHELNLATQQLASRTDYESDAYAKLIERVNALSDRRRNGASAGKRRQGASRPGIPGRRLYQKNRNLQPGLEHAHGAG